MLVYSTWKERAVIADILREMGMHNRAKQALDFNTPQNIVCDLLNMIVKDARATNKYEVLERLYFAGMIYE